MVGLVAACSVSLPPNGETGSPPTSAPTAASSSGSPTPSGTVAVALSGVCRAIGDLASTVEIGGFQRAALIHRPVAAVGRAPLVIALHGHLASPDAMITQTGLSKAADRIGFIVAYPAGETGEWGIQLGDARFERDHQFLGQVVDTLVAGGCVDPARVVLTGYSLGGILAHTLACADADRFHLIVAVSAREVGEPCRPTRPVTFIAYSGLDDQVIPYQASDQGGWHLPSAEAWMAGWAARDGCSAGPETAATNERVDRAEWTAGCKAPVVLYRIRHGTHTWPSSDPPFGGLGTGDTDPTATILRLIGGQAP